MDGLKETAVECPNVPRGSSLGTVVRSDPPALFWVFSLIFVCVCVWACLRLCFGLVGGLVIVVVVVSFV